MTARLWEIGCYQNKTKQNKQPKNPKGSKSFQVEEFPRVEGRAKEPVKSPYRTLMNHTLAVSLFMCHNLPKPVMDMTYLHPVAEV